LHSDDSLEQKQKNKKKISGFCWMRNFFDPSSFYRQFIIEFVFDTNQKKERKKHSDTFSHLHIPPRSWQSTMLSGTGGA
jgi:hypothetical protein